MRKRVRIVGDHPWRGESGTAFRVRDMGLAGEMIEVKLDRTEGIGGTDTVLASADELRALPRDEDPVR